MRLILAPVGQEQSSISCNLIGIERGNIHLHSGEWIRPGTRAVLKFDLLRVAGEVGYCNRTAEDFRTCFVVGNNRRAIRVPVDEAGCVTILGEGENPARECRLTDMSRFGLSLNTALPIKPGSMIFVQTDSLLAIGEVRHQTPAARGGLHTGVEVTEMLSDDTARRRNRGVRHRIAEVILGRPIGLP